MIQIPTWKVYTVIVVCILGIFYSLPNLVSQSVRDTMSTLPSWMPQKTVNLGLDLRGGAQLLYQLEVGKVIKDRADALRDDMRKTLREEKIGYTGLGILQSGVEIQLKSLADGEKVRSFLRRNNDTELEISSSNDGLNIQATFSDAAQEEIVTQVVSQAIEVVRRRIDELGTTEPAILRQGRDRILIQAPGANAEEL